MYVYNNNDDNTNANAYINNTTNTYNDNENNIARLQGDLLQRLVLRQDVPQHPRAGRAQVHALVAHKWAQH